MKPKTSCGFDGISLKILKTIKEILAEPLTIIINQMLNRGIFPDLLKIAKVTALELVDRIMTEMDKNETPIIIYLDLSKAFDTFKQNILLRKLDYYGIEDANLNLFQNYLTNRKQYVEFGDNKSYMLDITTGVPLGSILGPLLFIIYINDMTQVSKIFKFIMYADDTTLSTTFKCF